jgi:hypothetical protein
MPPGFRDMIAINKPRYKKTFNSIQVDNVKDLIGNVSDKSRPYHEKHLETLKRTDVEKWEFSIIGLDIETVLYFMAHHPLQELRSWCNIARGLIQFCRQEYYSGLGAMHDMYKEIDPGKIPKLSMHQKEMQSAIKLHVLAARSDDRTYGVKYLHGLLSNSPRDSRSLMRTLRAYRLTGYLFDIALRLYRNGSLSVKVLDAIHHEYEFREVIKYKYKRQTEMRTHDDVDYSDIRKMIEGSTEELFNNLNNYAVAINADQSNMLVQLGSTGAPEQSELHFNIGLTEHVDMMIKKLGLTPSGPRGIIDIGDIDLYVDDDWE